MEILTEFDGLQEALKKVKMDESVMPYVNGRLVDDGAWNKTQKILNCPEMISAHKYLYNLDMDQLTEEEIGKIDQLYKLGCDRGFIIDDLTDWDSAETPDQAEAKPEEVKPEEPIEKPVGGTLFKAKVPCWTVIYSAAAKDGSIKTGEAYSNAISASAAKADVNAKLSRIGYSNISILAIEATDACDCAAAKACAEEEVAEDDMLDGRVHNNHVSEADKGEETTDDEGAEEEETEEDTEEDSEEEESTEETSTEEEKKEETKSEKTSKEDSEESAEENSEEEEEEEDTEEESSEDSEEENDEEQSDDGEEKEELDANEKAELKDKYKKTFKNVLSKCKFETSFNDLTLEQKVKFFTELSKAWKKNEPTEFMTDKEVEQLNNVVVKENAEED